MKTHNQVAAEEVLADFCHVYDHDEDGGYKSLPVFAGTMDECFSFLDANPGLVLVIRPVDVQLLN
jgi:hypothetical protein